VNRTLAGLLMAAGLWPDVAQAELWGFVDGAGVAHVAPTQIDSRYRLVLGDRAPASAASAPGERVPGKADRTESLLLWLAIAPEVKVLQPLLLGAAREHGVDVELLKAIITVESGFNAKAVSPRGAIGLMQITPETADRYARGAEARRPAAERLLDARTNVHTGARMLADLTRRFGSIDIALAAWNAGEGTVRRHGGKMPPIDETRAHVHLVLELYWALLQDSQSRRATEVRLHGTPR
jgi:soluble lytic murein transglycosylase-like protein